MTTVISQGTGRRAALGPGQFAAGKTGTTENSGDAWFVGFTKRWTVAVWVGYPDKLKPMLTEFAGAPVEGGTYPALIWHDFMVAANAIADDRNAKERERKGPAAQAAGRPDDDHHAGTGHPDQAGARARGRRQRSAGSADADRAAVERRRHEHRHRGRRRDERDRHDDDQAAGPDHHDAAGRRRDRAAPEHRRRHQRALSLGAAQAACARRGHGRDTWRLPRAQKRQSRSTAFVIPIALADVEHRRLPAGGARLDADRPVEQRGAVELEADAERLRELARAVAQLLVARDAPARAHDLDAVERLAARG